MVKKFFFLIGKKNKLLKINFLYSIISLMDIFGISYLAILVSKVFFKNNNLDITFLNFEFIKNYDFNSIVFFLLTIFFLRLLVYLYANYEIIKFINDTSKNLRLKFLDNYLMPNFMNYMENKSDYFKIFSNKIDVFSNDLLQAVLKFLGNSINVFLITAYLFILNFKITLLVLMILFFFSIFYISVSKNLLKKISLKYFEESGNIFGNFLNIISNVLEIKIYNKKKFFLEISKKSIDRFNKMYLNYTFIQILPRQILEFLIISIILLLFLFIEFETIEDKNKIFLEFSIFIMAIFRLMPSSLYMINTANSINFSKEPINEIYDFLKPISKSNTITYREVNEIEKIVFKNINISFNNKILFENKNFEINKGDKVSIAGNSGSGKTTLIKIMLGLAKPDSGDIYINNVNINTLNLNNIWSKISYASQNSLILESSIIENIAMNNDLDQIEIDKIKSLCQFLEIEYLLENETSIISKNLNKLSGGERQRVILARALYFDRNVMILDEATNALDKTIEGKIIEYLMNSDKTVIFISHSLDLKSKVDLNINI